MFEKAIETSKNNIKIDAVNQISQRVQEYTVHGGVVYLWSNPVSESYKLGKI